MNNNSLLQYTFDSPRPQNFSLPRNFIYYINKNPCSSKGYEKLQKTCKYFYSENPIIIIESLNDLSEEWMIQFSHTGKEIKIRAKEVFLNPRKPYKIWLTFRLDLYKMRIAKLFHKTYKFEAKSIRIQFRILDYNELLNLSLSPYITSICFDNTNVIDSYDDDKSIVPIEDIFRLFPKINDFECTGFMETPVTSMTVKMLLKNVNFKNIKRFIINNVREIFDFATFSEFMKKNTQTYFSLSFTGHLSDNYKAQLHLFREWMVKNKNLYKQYYSRLPNITF